MIYLFVLGLCFGSFALALVDRLHAKKDWVNGRSECEYCGHVLGFWDLIPLVSWTTQGGKCRYCKHKLSWQYPVVELLCGILFAVSLYAWPTFATLVDIFLFCIWLFVIVMFVAMTVYDLRWMLLPNGLVFSTIGAAGVYALLTALASDNVLEGLLLALGGLLVGGGLFYLLFQVSDGKWIGGGDVKLGFALGLLAGSPLNAGLVLFLASVFGLILGLPLMFGPKKKRKKQIPFGPFLMLATYIVVLFGPQFIHWYYVTFLLI